MPELKFVVASEKTIIDQTGPVSLINIFQRMKIQLLPGVPLPEKAVTPNQWSIFCLWQNDPREIGREFTQVTQVYGPDGSLFVESEATFRNDDIENKQTKTNLVLTAMPIWSQGTAVIRVWLRGAEANVGTYEFDIEHIAPALQPDSSQ